MPLAEMRQARQGAAFVKRACWFAAVAEQFRIRVKNGRKLTGALYKYCRFSAAHSTRGNKEEASVS